MTGADFTINLVNAIIEAIASGKGKIIVVDSAGNVISDISLSALRDALKGANNKDFSTLEADVEDLKGALDSVGTDKLLTTPDNPPNLDIAISALRDALKPTRSTPEQVLSGQSIAAGDKAEFVVSGTEGYSAVVVTVKASYDPSATAGVRVRWLYSPDGTNFDSEDSAEAEGQYTDLKFVAGETKVETVLIPIFQPYVKVQIVNLDSSYAVTVDAWKTLMR